MKTRDASVLQPGISDLKCQPVSVCVQDLHMIVTNVTYRRGEAYCSARLTWPATPDEARAYIERQNRALN